jgi:hypothetical protein
MPTNTMTTQNNTAIVKTARSIFSNLDRAFYGWSNPIEKLLAATLAEERTHRKSFPGKSGMSAAAAAEVLALSWLGKFYTGKQPMPSIESLLDSTQTYCLAAAIVSKHRAQLAEVFDAESAEFCASLDYAALMQ